MPDTAKTNGYNEYQPRRKMRQILLGVLFLLPLLTMGQSKNISSLLDALKNNDCNKAKPLIETMIGNGESLGLAYYGKASCAFQSQQYDEAISFSLKVLKLISTRDSLYSPILSIRAMAYGFLGKLDSAIIDQETLVGMNPSNVYALLNLSFLYGQNFQSDKAINVLMKALQLDSLNVYVINNLAFEYCELKDFDEAIKYAQRGLKLTKDSVWKATLLNSLGYAQAMSISTEKGLQTIQESLKYNPLNPYAYFNIGRIYLEKKDLTNACIYFRKTKDLGGLNLSESYLEKYCK